MGVGEARGVLIEGEVSGVGGGELGGGRRRSRRRRRETITRCFPSIYIRQKLITGLNGGLIRSFG